MDILNNKYEHYIHERYTDLIKSKKPELDNNDLWKIFEYYSCLELSKIYKKTFYEYDDIDPDFKEKNKMSRNDTGIDLSDLDKTIVQCKLRKNALTWKECSTFFGSQNIFDKELNKAIVRWEHLIIARNSDSVLSENLLERKELFIDMPFDNKELIKFCENLILNPPKLINPNTDFLLRDYQQESINMIKNNKKNVMINLPTGTGKNSVIIYSFEENKKYLILVPRIILMEQLKEEIIKHKPKLKSKIQLIGDENNEFKDNKLITICVFNSVKVIEEYADKFEKIYIDEAHHINKPEIYYSDDDLNEDEAVVNNEKNDEKNDEKNNELDSDISDDEFNSDVSDDESNSDISDDEVNSDITDDEVNSDISDDEYEAEELIDDPEDELKNVNTYTQIIKSLVKHNNNVYLSATIDKTDNFEYYSKDIRNMIELGYLCDYTIHIPIFSEDPDNNKTCEYLLKNYKNIIIYCNSQKEGKEINRIMNMKQKNSSEYVDCNTPKKKRNEIINRYKTGDIPFLVNVRILVEGFDAPTTKGVVFLHLPRNKTTLIQIIGRALRLHPTKTIANIILPFSSKEDEKNIGNFLKIMAQNDGRIRKSFENKTVGGYVSIDRVEDTEDDEVNNKIEFKYNMVYDSMGKLLNGEEVWMARLEEVKKYIDEHGKRPSKHSGEHKIILLGRWMMLQNKLFKKNLLKNERYNKWHEFINNDKYKKFFIPIDEVNILNWNRQFLLLKAYMDKYDISPSSQNSDENIYRLGRFKIRNSKIYETKTQIMSNENIYNIWTDFMNDDKYKKFFLSSEEKWFSKLGMIKTYIDNHNMSPTKRDKCDKNAKKLGTWIQVQKRNFKYNIDIMKTHPMVKKTWDNFVNSEKYRKYFLDDITKWETNLQIIKTYLTKHNKTPECKSKYGRWLTQNIMKYKYKTHGMNNEYKYNKFDEFIKNPLFSKFFIKENEKDKWMNKLMEIKTYIDTYGQRPPHDSKKSEYVRSLGSWITHNLTNMKNKSYIMECDDIYNEWCEFITSPIYKIHFMNNEELFDYRLNELKIFIDLHKRRPCAAAKNINERQLGNWVSDQFKITRNSHKPTYKKWIDFVGDKLYSQHFISKEEKWKNKFEELKIFIDDNNHVPTEKGELTNWFRTQKTNYKNRLEIMKHNDDIYNIWKNFYEDIKYKKYFTTFEEEWKNNFNKVVEYINGHNNRPSLHNDNIDVKRIAQWITDCQKYYRLKKGRFKDPQYQHMWYNFITDPQYKQHFDQNIAKPDPILTNPIKTETNDPDKNTSPTTAFEAREKIIVKTPRKKKTPKD
jgi:hypothetical protein